MLFLNTDFFTTLWARQRRKEKGGIKAMDSHSLLLTISAQHYRILDTSVPYKYFAEVDMNLYRSYPAGSKYTPFIF